jgi:hypothetical protein
MNELKQQPLWIQRSLAWSVLMVLLAVLASLFMNLYLQPLQTQLHQWQQRSEKGRRIAVILEQEPAVRDWQRRYQVLGLDRLFLPERSASRAASALQNRVKRLVSSQSGAKIQAIKPYPVEMKSGYAEISLEIRIRDLSHAGLERVLRGIESSLPALVIRQVSIKRPVSRYEPMVRPDRRDNRLAVTLVVGGFFLPDGEGA